jgi:translocation and assembly module TamB
VLRQAEFSGAWPMRLNAPANLLLARERQQVDQLALSLAGGSLNLTRFSRDGARIASSGSLHDLPLAPLLALLATPPPLTSDLRFNGDWDLRLADALDGHLALRRQSGDLGWREPSLPLGLSALTIGLDIVANRVNADIAAVGAELGSLRADAQASLTRAGAGFSLPRAAPLTWKAELEMPDLRLLKPFIPLGMRADAQISARLSGGGSLAAPRIAGKVDASRIRFTMVEEGIAISDGLLGLDLDDDRVRVREGVLHSGGGRVVLSGEAQLRNPQAGLRLRFEKFAATNRSDRRIIVSGDTRLNLEANRLLLSGELTADRARLEMPEAGRPRLGADVVIVGQPPRPPSASQRFPLALDLKLNLGNDFLFKGAGLDARLGGEMRVITVNRALRGEGGIQVVEGRYAAYGQKLDIERGILRFVGPIDNPGLDVLAVRKTATVTAGVQVRGTVRRPVVTLYSDPPLPDTEKLAWLVLGHGLEGGGQQEFALLQIAAGTLLSQADSVSFQSRLAEALRIDSFDLRAGDGEDLASSVVSVGKRLSSRTQLSYEQSLDGLSQVVKVIYQLSPRVRLEAQTGQQQSSFDAFYTREYD